MDGEVVEMGIFTSEASSARFSGGCASESVTLEEAIAVQDIM